MTYLKTSIRLFFFFCVCFHGAFAQSNFAELNPPKLIEEAEISKAHALGSRKFSGIPSIAVSPKGRMWAVWYTGITPGEDLNNYVVLATSTDQGKTWKEVLVIDPDGPGPVRAYDPEIWLAPDGKIKVFWAQAAAKRGGTWTLVTEGTAAGVWALDIADPETDIPTWGEPKRLADGVMMCKPIVLSTGEWVLPVSFWKLEKENARMVVSSDGGQSWQVRGGASVPDKFRSYDEHMIVERKDRSLWMLIRTKHGIGEATSLDRGVTWTPVVPSRIQHPSARFFIYRLHSGNLMLVKHGPVDQKIGRSHLMAFISKDDGHSWSDGLLLDERPGVSYPDGQQVSDGTIFIIYDFNRTGNQDILMTHFSESDILSGRNSEMILKVFTNRKLISTGVK
ncbi:MAG: exo-alpha-sialidase [Lunatimonas sp.]|uniref:sialidase family protein n=1 Tax=Lunatimonas sp. TaxID=2060141 RepID=UPI00263B90DF|nr:sialidase family protein [Lunatimonas sp.]MCC5938249.1 exo-alpha-sialidase [Lunatimonas sp.]